MAFKNWKSAYELIMLCKKFFFNPRRIKSIQYIELKFLGTANRAESTFLCNVKIISIVQKLHQTFKLNSAYMTLCKITTTRKYYFFVIFLLWLKTLVSPLQLFWKHPKNFREVKDLGYCWKLFWHLGIT